MRRHTRHRRMTPLAAALLLGLLLSACAPSAPSQPTPSQSPTMQAPTLPPPTEQPPPAAPTAAPLKAVSEADWSRGAEDARVRIVVYSDFQ